MSEYRNAATVISVGNSIGIIAIILYYNNKIAALQQKIDELTNNLVGGVKAIEGLGGMVLPRVGTLEEFKGKLEFSVTQQAELIRTEIEKMQNMNNTLLEDNKLLRHDLDTIVNTLAKGGVKITLLNSHTETAKSKTSNKDQKYTKPSKKDEPKSKKKIINNPPRNLASSDSDSDDDHASDVVNSARF